VVIPLHRVVVKITSRVPEVRQKAGGGAHRNVQVAGGRRDATPLLPHYPHQGLPRLDRLHRERPCDRRGRQAGAVRWWRWGGTRPKRTEREKSAERLRESRSAGVKGKAPGMGLSTRRLPAFAASFLASQLGSAAEAINFLHCEAFLHGFLRVGERRRERTTGCMNKSLVRNYVSGTPDFCTIRGATSGTAVGKTSNRGTKRVKCCAELGRAKRAGHSIERADAMTRAGASILLKLPNCIFVPCTRVPVRIGHNWADCNTDSGLVRRIILRTDRRITREAVSF